MNKEMTKSIISIAASVLVLAAFVLMPAPEALGSEGMAAIGILIATLILWVTEAIPLIISALLAMMIMPFLGVLDWSSIYTNFASSAFIFILASFVLVAAMEQTSIPLRVTNWMLQKTGTNPKKVVAGFFAITAVVSAFIANTPCCAMFLGLALGFLKANGDPKPGTSNLARALMLAIPFACAVGGLATPAGNALNVMAVGIFMGATGINVGFLNWMIVGVPCAILMSVLGPWWLCKIFKPEEVKQEAIDSVKKQVEELGKMNAIEIKFLVIFALMIVAWIASTWFTVINTTFVAVVGIALMSLPGVGVLTRENYTNSLRGKQLEGAMILGGVSVLVAGLSAWGVGTWLIESTISGAAGWPLVAVFLLLSVIVCVMHIAIPVGPACLGAALVPALAVATLVGCDPVIVLFIVAFWAACEFIFPIDGIYLITYGFGYYSMTDMMKWGWFPNVMLLIITTAVVPLLAGICMF